MHEHVTPEADPLAPLLTVPPAHAEDGRSRAELLGRTRRVVARRRRLRRAAWAAALAACYAAGLLTTDWLAPRPRPAPDRPVVKEAPAVEKDRPPERAVVLEWKAVDSTEGRADLYRRAGDRYLADESDFESAVRCYGQALDAGTEADRAVSPEDNWLLMALKDARKKEKPHAENAN
jgi:hypothetical protein